MDGWLGLAWLGLDLSKNTTPPRAPCGANNEHVGKRQRWEQSGGVEEDNDLVERLHRHRWINHWQWNLCLTKWGAPGK